MCLSVLNLNKIVLIDNCDASVCRYLLVGFDTGETHLVENLG